MNKACLNILIPGLGKRWQCGGLSQLIKTASLDLSIKTRLITYIDREDGYLFLKDYSPEEFDFFLIGWGPHITFLSNVIPNNRAIINSFSFLNGSKPPQNAPVICSSRYTLSNWARYESPRPLFLIPALLEKDYINKKEPRPIDILVFERKISPYVKNLLLPKLEKSCNVHCISTYVEDLSDLYNKSKILIYDSRWHFRSYRTEEGFGLHPLEARACGCWVFTSFNGALSQYHGIEGFHQIHVNDSDYDINTIIKVLSSSPPPDLDTSYYRKDNITKLWNETLDSCITFLSSSQSNDYEMSKLRKLNFQALVKSYLHRINKRLGFL